VIHRTDLAIAALEQKRAKIDETLAELRVINADTKRNQEKLRCAADAEPDGH
jgi:hypothetical protein